MWMTSRNGGDKDAVAQIGHKMEKLPCGTFCDRPEREVLLLNELFLKHTDQS